MSCRARPYPPYNKLAVSKKDQPKGADKNRKPVVREAAASYPKSELPVITPEEFPDLYKLTTDALVDLKAGRTRRLPANGHNEEWCLTDKQADAWASDVLHQHESGQTRRLPILGQARSDLR